jgi:hypothetical protein
VTALIVIGAILAVLAVIAFLRVGVHAVYGDGQLSAVARVGFVKLRIYPAKPTKRKKPAKARTKTVKRGAKTKKSPAKADKKAKTERGKFDITGFVSGAAQLLLRMGRRVLIKRLMVRYVAAGMWDPATAAIAHGGISAVFGLSQGVLEQAFRIRRYRFESDVNFLSDKPEIYVEADISIAIWEITAIGIAALSLYLKSRGKPVETSKTTATAT